MEEDNKKQPESVQPSQEEGNAIANEGAIQAAFGRLDENLIIKMEAPEPWPDPPPEPQDPNGDPPTGKE